MPAGAQRIIPPAAVLVAVLGACAVMVSPITPWTWREGLVRAGRFAPFCARAMLLPTAPKDLDDARVQASFYGIGLWVLVAGELRTLVDAEPFVRMRHSSGQWSFAEEIHRQVTGSRSTGP
jgi:hypothetical protein